MEAAQRKYRDRWGKKEPRLNEDGSLKPVFFTGQDLEICKLLAPQINAREPWSYQYMLTKYFGPVLGRGPQGAGDRVSELASDPYSYLELAPGQPEFMFVQQIYRLGPMGKDKLKKAGYTFPRRYHYRAFPHELMCIVCAASFEIGARKHGLSLKQQSMKLDFFPDWPPFKLGTTTVLFECDRNTASLESNLEQSSAIEGKLENYLSIIHKGFGGMVIFFVTTHYRQSEIIELIKKVIDRKRYPHAYAAQIGVMYIEYDQFTKRPLPTDWAVKNSYERAGHAPFSFV
jgi:hypothetical protein